MLYFIFRCESVTSGKPATATKPSDSQMTPTDKSSEDGPKISNLDENPDGEEIADDLSEISDEADDILGQQEVHENTFLPTLNVAYFIFKILTLTFSIQRMQMQSHNSQLKIPPKSR